MSMPRKFTCERDVKRATKHILDESGAWHFMPSMNGFGRAGIPDVIACYCGTLLAIETKFGKNKPTEAQRKELRTINEAGGIAVVITERDLDSLRALLQQLRNSQPE